MAGSRRERFLADIVGRCRLPERHETISIRDNRYGVIFGGLADGARKGKPIRFGSNRLRGPYRYRRSGTRIKDGNKPPCRQDCDRGIEICKELVGGDGSEPREFP